MSLEGLDTHRSSSLSKFIYYRFAWYTNAQYECVEDIMNNLGPSITVPIIQITVSLQSWYKRFSNKIQNIPTGKVAF